MTPLPLQPPGWGSAALQCLERWPVMSKWSATLGMTQLPPLLRPAAGYGTRKPWASGCFSAGNRVGTWTPGQEVAHPPSRKAA